MAAHDFGSMACKLWLYIMSVIPMITLYIIIEQSASKKLDFFGRGSKNSG